MTAPRKTPRTDAAVDKHSFLDGSRELHPDIIPFIQDLEIETQELAEALSKIADVSCRESSLMVARAALARHRAAQEVGK